MRIFNPSPGYGFSEPFGFSCSDDAPQHLKPISPLRRIFKNNAVFYFPVPVRYRILHFMRHPERQILRKENAASHKRDSNQPSLPHVDMCTGITVLHGFTGRKVPGGGFQLSIKLCIIVHAFLTI